MIKLWENAPFFKEEYGQEEPALYEYLADGKKNPAIIVCAGGGYDHRAYHEGEPIAKWLQSIGISAFNLAYRFKPYTYKSTVSEILRSVQVLRYNCEKLNINPNKIGVLGFSAGGHLASCAATHFCDFEIAGERDDISKISPRPDAAVLGYPLTFTDDKMVGQFSFYDLFGEGEDKEEFDKYFSTAYHVCTDTPPTFLWHTSEDQIVNVKHSLVFAERLRDNNIPFELHVFPHGRHGLGLDLNNETDRVSEWTKSCENWLKTIEFI